MKRNINIISNNYIRSVANFENIHIDNIDGLINFSIDNIILGFINFLDKKTAQKIMLGLLSKIRPQGSVIISFIDLQLVCKNYLNNNISNDDMINLIKPINNIVNIDEIMTYIDIAKFRITSISRQNTNIVLNITRIEA